MCSTISWCDFSYSATVIIPVCHLACLCIVVCICENEAFLDVSVTGFKSNSSSNLQFLQFSAHPVTAEHNRLIPVKLLFHILFAFAAWHIQALHKENLWFLWRPVKSRLSGSPCSRQHKQSQQHFSDADTEGVGWGWERASPETDAYANCLLKSNTTCLLKCCHLFHSSFPLKT